MQVLISTGSFDLYKWEPTARFLLRHYKDYDLQPSQSWDWIKDHIDRGTWDWLWTVGIQKGLFRHGNCYRGAFEALRELSKTQDIVLITTRPAEATRDTLAWVAYHEIPAREVHILGEDRKKSSVEVCDWYVDDNVENANDLASTGKPVYLWERSWNRWAVLHEGVERVQSWSTLLWRVT